MRLRKIVAEVARTGDPWIIQKDGKPAAILVDFDQYEAMLALIGIPRWEDTTAGKR